MEATAALPKAFSVRDDRSFRSFETWWHWLNPKLLVAQVATGVHVDGGCTVNWARFTWTASRSRTRTWRPP